MPGHEPIEGGMGPENLLSLRQLGIQLVINTALLVGLTFFWNAQHVQTSQGMFLPTDCAKGPCYEIETKSQFQDIQK